MALPELDLEHLSHLVIRSRPASMAELRMLTGAGEHDEHLLLERLTGSGMVTRDGDQLLYRSPQQVVTDNLTELLETTLATLEATQARATRLMGDLPTLLEDWTLGTGDQFGRSMSPTVLTRRATCGGRSSRPGRSRSARWPASPTSAGSTPTTSSSSS